jgi:hypothetical protein
MRRLRRLAAALLLAGLAGCASIARLEPPPPRQTETFAILGVPSARFMADGDVAPWAREANAAAARRQEAEQRAPGAAPRRVNFLALSGGGDNGAFGAGLLTGWSQSGTRPEFDVVTGISAGALIAPFAFLGPDYDPQLRAVFNDVAPGDILVVGRIFTALLFGEAIADTSPLYRLIERHADQAMLDAIGREYRRGRLLLIGTTNLDIRRPVVWNIGAIAASGHPGGLDLFRRILLASASVPGAFPPVFIDIELEGRRFQEMHVDGGAATQVFLYPPGLDLRSAAANWGGQRSRTAWVIRNGRIDVESGPTNRSVFRIAARSVETLLHFSGVADIYRIYLTTQRDGVDFRLAAIGPDFSARRDGPFAPDFMRALFAYGVEQGRSGTAWMDRPPPVGIIVPEETAATRLAMP